MTNKRTGAPFACKIVKLHSFSAQQKEILLREIDIMKMLDHPNIIKVVGVYKSLNMLYEIMELCTGGDLLEKLLEQPT